MRHKRNYLALLILSFGTFAFIHSQEPPGEPPGGGGGGGGGQGESADYGNNWNVMSSEYDGVLTHYNWDYDYLDIPDLWIDRYPWITNPVPANAANSTSWTLPAIAVDAGTITVRLEYTGQGNPPGFIWLKVGANAMYAVTTPDPDTEAISGSVSHGLSGDVVSTNSDGKSISGSEYFYVAVVDGIAEKTITLDADGTYNKAWGTITASVGAVLETPDTLVFELEEMVFDTDMPNMHDQDSTYGSTSGSYYPINGWGPTGSYPLLMKKGSDMTVDLSQRARLLNSTEVTPGIKYDVLGTMTGFSWPQIDDIANEEYNSLGTDSQGPITAYQSVQNKIYKFQYGANWQMTSEDPFSDDFDSTGTETIYVTWDESKNNEVPTRKRVHWAVNAANGATTIEEAADGIHVALAGDPPIEPAYAYQYLPESEWFEHSLPDCETEDVWKLLDSTHYGECDEQARLMARAVNLLGIDAGADFVFASSDADPVDVLETDWQNGSDVYLYMDFDGSDISETFPGNHYRWNQYEGVCRVPLTFDSEGEVTSERVYAVWPSHKANTMLDMLQLLGDSEGIKQYWIYLIGSPEISAQTGVLRTWIFNGVANTTPVPIPPG